MKYKYLKSFIEGNLERYLSESEFEDLLRSAERDLDWNRNIGFFVNRTHHNEREKAFSEEWFNENEPKSFLNNGHGILQDLFIEKKLGVFNNTKVLHEITPIEREIVATVIQWLGSNIGMSFLEKSLEKCGYKIVKK